MVNKFAKDAVESGTKVYFNLFRTNFESKIKANMKEKHNQILKEESQHKGKLYFENYYSPQGAKNMVSKNK